MMRPMAVSVATSLPYPPTGVTVTPGTAGADLAWIDATPVDYAGTATWGDPSNEIGFRVERAPIGNNGKAGTYVALGTTLANQARFRDTTADPALTYSYRIVAVNAAGESVSAPVGGPVPAPPQAPTNVVATLAAGPSITVTWRDNASNEAYFVLERSVDGGSFAYLSAPPARSNTGTVTFTDPAVSTGHTYQYRVSAVNGGGSSAAAVSNAVTIASPPLAPSGLAGTAVRSGKKANVTLTWVDGSTDETGFELQRATNASFTVGLATSALAANTVTVTQTGLYRGVTYYYRIRAVNGGGASAWSNVATVITP